MRTNIEILESLSVNHKKLKEEKPYLLFKILKAMDVARTEQLSIPDVVGQSEQLVSFLRQYQKTCEILHVNKIDAKNFVEQYKTN